MEDKEYKSLMKKVHKVINKAEDIGYEFSDLECGVISRIANADTIDRVLPEFYKTFNIIYEKIIKGKTS